MGQPIMIRVFEVVGSGLCVASGDGQKVHDQIAVAIRANQKVQISFMNVESLTSAFLNTAIGQLYGEFGEDQIKAHLTVVDMEPEDLALLKRVVETAKEYFKDPRRFEEATREALGE